MPMLLCWPPPLGRTRWSRWGARESARAAGARCERFVCGAVRVGWQSQGIAQRLPGLGHAHKEFIGLEARESDPGEGEVLTKTAGQAWGVWQAVLALRGWTARTVQTQAVDRVLGLQPVGRQARKMLVIYSTVEVLAGATHVAPAAWRQVLTPTRARTISDGAADALWIALGLARGL